MIGNGVEVLFVFGFGEEGCEELFAAADSKVVLAEDDQRIMFFVADRFAAKEVDINLVEIDFECSRINGVVGRWNVAGDDDILFLRAGRNKEHKRKKRNKDLVCQRLFG